MKCNKYGGKVVCRWTFYRTCYIILWMINIATPVKQVKFCIVCSKSISWHVRLLKNIELKIIFLRNFVGVGRYFPNLDNTYICDSCLTVITKTKDLRQKCEMNLANISLHQNRQKRVIIHSVSSKDKVKRVTSVSNVTRKCGKKLFISHPESCNKENLK